MRMLSKSLPAACEDMQRKIKASISLLLLVGGIAVAQLPPSHAEINNYTGLFAAVAGGNIQQVERLIAEGADPNARDQHGRTPLMVATYLGNHRFMHILKSAGADPNATDSQRYDIVTIAAVADDLPTLKVALLIGGDPTNVTSPYKGTALIAAAHLGHAEVVRALTAAGAPLDHVNNLGWTALIEAIVLGNGGPDHTATVKILLDAGASPGLADSGGETPISLARARGYDEIVSLLKRASANSG